MMRKIYKLILSIAILTIVFSSSSMAGQWKRDKDGWWYSNEDGSYPSNGWQWIDSQCYYFTSDGYILINTTTPDGYTVDGNGAWHENYYVHHKNDIPKERFTEAILNYYNNLTADDGSYDIFNSETTRDHEGNYTFIVRYQMTEDEAEELISEGSEPFPNIFVSELLANVKTGEVRFDNDDFLLKIE